MPAATIHCLIQFQPCVLRLARARTFGTGSSATLDQTTADGLQLYQAGKFPEAAGRFASALRRAPDHAVALRLQGLSLLRTGAFYRSAAAAGARPPTHSCLSITASACSKPPGPPARPRCSDTPSACCRRIRFPWIIFSTAILALGQARPGQARAGRLALA
jgi:hypothetical protein